MYCVNTLTGSIEPPSQKKRRGKILLIISFRAILLGRGAHRLRKEEGVEEGKQRSLGHERARLAHDRARIRISGTCGSTGAMAL